MPYVLIDRKIAGLKANYVGVNDETVGQIATQHLIACGCRAIAHIGGPKIGTAVGRMEGCRKALARHGLSAPSNFVVGGQYEDAGGYRAMRRLLALKHRPDGVFCFNDPVAAGPVKAILKAGLDIPHAAELLLRLIDKRTRGPQTILLSPQLIVRESSVRNGASRPPFTADPHGKQALVSFSCPNEPLEC